MKKAVLQWAILAIVAVAITIASALVSRDVYSKDEVDTKFEHTETVGEMRYDELKEQNVRIEGKVDRLVDHLIEEDN